MALLFRPLLVLSIKSSLFQDQDSLGRGFQADQAFTGILQDVYVLNEELLLDEVNEIYKLGRKGLPASLNGD